MLRMDKVYVIRHKVMTEGKSISAVARDLGISRNTISKYLTESEPFRKETASRERPVMDKVAPRIDELLEEWKYRITPKQRVTGSRILRQLHEEHHLVGITTVRDYLREKRRKSAEVFIPLVYRPGDEGQFDFFEVTVEEHGQFRHVWELLLHFPYCERDYLNFYDSCDQLAFLDGHVRAAAFFGGLPRRIVYDNLSVAVKRKVGLEPQLTGRFQALVSHYLFEPCFTRPGEGHDKGSVESRGKGIRLQHLTPVPRGDSLVDIAAAVLKEVDDAWRERVREDERQCWDLWLEERRKLIALPAWPFDPRRVVMVPVSSKAIVEIEGVKYSLPSRWARLDAKAYIGVDDIRLVCGGETEVVARQRRGEKCIQYRHYLPELARKPQAVRQVAPELVAELGEPYSKLWTLLETRYGGLEAARIFARVLGAIIDHGTQAVGEALKSALQADRCDLLALSSHLQEAQATVEVPKPLQGYQIETVSPAEYDVLLAGGVR